MGGDPTADPSSAYFIDADHPYAAAAASALTSHRSRSKWSHLSSLAVPDPLPASAVAAVPLLLRRRPHVALSFHLFATRRLLPSGSPPPLLLSVSAAHVAAASRLRRAAISLLSSAARHYPHSQIFAALAATYRRFASAPFVFDLLLLAYLRSRRDALAAASVARRILAAGARPLPSTSAALLRSLPSAAAALDMYREIYTRPSSRINSQLLPTVHTFNSLLLAFYREGKCDVFKVVLQEMDRYSCVHNVCTYNIRMAAYCDSKEVEKARGLWDEMVEGGIQPDVPAYNTMISGYCGVGEVGMAEEMFKDMEMGGIDPSVTTFEWLVRGHCRVGDIDAAMLVRADMSRRGFQMAAEVVEEVVNVLCQKKRVKEALGVLKEEMRKEEFVPSRECYEVLIRELCEQGEVEVAMRLQAEMAGMGFKVGSEVYCAFVCAYEKAEDYEMAEKLRKELSRRKRMKVWAGRRRQAWAGPTPIPRGAASRRKERTILRRQCHFLEHKAACRRLVHRVAHRKENVQVDQSALKSDAISMSKEELSKT
uniref:Pentacotripeptide-repeat region of PRORP domain-containing protein n=1 Tax=Oryza nivara TaxID=4536 RepID=A0A0E0J6C0_ORYNI